MESIEKERLQDIRISILIYRHHLYWRTTILTDEALTLR